MAVNASVGTRRLLWCSMQYCRSPNIVYRLSTTANRRWNERGRGRGGGGGEGKRRFSGLQWFGIPVGLGITCLALLQLERTVRRERRRGRQREEEEETSWQLAMFQLIPARLFSRGWGKLMEKEMPQWLRRPLLGLYVRVYGCKLEEACVEDLSEYQSLMALFTRSLKDGVRPVNDKHCLVSPSDGKVLHYGRVPDHGRLEQVKGVTYSLDRFLGDKTTPTSGRSFECTQTPDQNNTNSQRNEIEESYIVLESGNEAITPTKDIHNTSPSQVDTSYSTVQRSYSAMETSHSGAEERGSGERGSGERGSGERGSEGGGTNLYHIIIYLAPGDYHGFHSPADWSAHTRRHFPGELLTVAPWAAQTMPGLFALNERAVLLGQWDHGFFSMAAVGAYNVGRIILEMDQELKTNQKGRYTFGQFSDKLLGNEPSNGLPLKKGQKLGTFQMGSSIVCVFEAPPGFTFTVTPGDSVCYGQSIGYVEED